MRDLIVAAMLLAGATMMLFSAIGLVRFRDALCRAHALTKATTFGVGLMLIALWVHLADEVSGLKLALILVFITLTIPLSSHYIALLLYKHRSEATQPPESDQTDTDSSRSER